MSLWTLIPPSDEVLIQRMFANGENGGYWPALRQYAYEDSAGTTQASVDGVVGLRFDVSRNLSSTLPIVNLLDFSEDTTQNRIYYVNTSSEQGASLAPNGRMTATRIVGTTDHYAYWWETETVFAAGKITGSIYLRADAPFNIGVRINSNGDGSGGGDTRTLVELTTDWVRYSVEMTTIATDGVSLGIDFRPVIVDGAQAGTVYVAQRQIQIGALTDYQETGPILGKPLGNHAIQATTGNKPYLRVTPTTNKYWYDSNTATGAMNVTFASALGSACTIATVTPEGVSILENQTVGTTYNICPPYGYNSDVLIINRALTPAEKALVTRVMQRSVPTLGSELVVNGDFSIDAAAEWAESNASTSLSAVAGRLRVSMVSPYSGSAFMAVASILNTGTFYYVKAKTYGGGGCLPQPQILVGLSTFNGVGSTEPGVETVHTATVNSGGSYNLYARIVSNTDDDGYAEFDDFSAKAIL